MVNVMGAGGRQREEGFGSSMNMPTPDGDIDEDDPHSRLLNQLAIE